MSEQKELIQNVVTRESLIKSLRGLGLGGNMIIEVHSSLSSFGYVVGGARTVVDALLEIAADGGTILMPSQTCDNSEPSTWQNPPLAPALCQTVRQAMPGFNPRTTDLRSMGDVAENFRHRNGVVISSHPSFSYAAWGRYAKLLCNRQSLHFPLAEESPAARLYELKGFVLLLGTDFASCTCMHLAEYRCDCRPIVLQGAAVEENGVSVWKKYLDLNIRSDDFLKIEPIMQKKDMIHETMIGSCRAKFFAADEAIDEATRYFEKTAIYDLYR